MKRIVKVVSIIFSLIVLVVGALALRIYSYSNNVSEKRADAAIVLGAAVWGRDLSPVFRERINHGIDLYRAQKVKKLILTGGQGNRNELTEAAAARQYALQRGVPASHILIEEKSHNTYENLLYAKQVMNAQGLQRALIVSDPLHMKRAVEMAKDVGLDAYPSPTPTSRYQSLSSQMGLLAHETYYYMGYLLSRPFQKKVATVNREQASAGATELEKTT